MKWKIRALCLVLICCSLASGNLSPVNPILSDDCTALCVQQCLHTSDGISLSLAFETPKIETVDESNSLQLASFPGSGMRLYPGEPATPMIGRLFRLPPSGGVMVEVLDAEYQTYTDVDYAACIDELDELEFGACSSVEDAWFPGPLVEVGDPAIFHDFRVANLLTNPVQVNPARQEVRVYSHMNLAVRYNSHDDRNTLAHHPAKLSSTFLPWYRDFLDWDDDELDEYEFYQGNVVVVMRDDDVLWESLEDWIAWKRQKGWKLDFLTDSDVDNWTSDGIISELIQRYEAAEEKFDFVVIIGDDTGSFTVPASSGYGSGSGDLFYTMLAGNDYLVDVAIGRMTVETFQHVVIASHKIITYECDMYLEEPVWYTRAMLSRSDTHEGITKVMTLRYWRSWLNEIGYTQVDTSWGLGNTAALAAINDGVSVYSHRGYIGSGIQANQVSALSNDYMLPVVIDLTCYTGNWSGDTGINETWFRTGAINSPRAGIGAIGMATAANRPSMLNPISGGAAYSLLVQRNPEMGLVWMGGEINLWQNQRINNPAVSQDEQQWCNLMGDPTTWLWTAAPESLFVSTPDLINLGTRQVNVQVTDSENNPVPNAWVTFYKVDENEDVVYSTLADADGFAYLQTECDYPGESIITVSAQNYLPSQTPVTVSLANDNVSFDDYEIVDDGNYQTIGNGDGIPQNGETIGLRLKLACNSDITQTGIFVTGSSADPCIEAVTGTVAIQSMEAGESEWADEVILVELADMIEDHWIVHVDLEFTADQSFHTTTCSFPIRAPQYGIVTTTMSDIEPGGNGTLFIMIQNTGGHEASTISGVISAYGNMFHSSQAYRPFGTLSPGETNSTSFSITAAQDALPGALVPCLLTLTSGNGHTFDLEFSVNFGSVDTSDVTGPDQYGYIAIENTDIIPIDSLVPVFDWIEINPDLQDAQFEGTLIDVEDPVENDDDAAVIELPFPIQYYGNTFNTMTISTNGYVAMGSQTDLSLPRNWIIPSPLGPNNMIAPYWDELRTVGDANISYYYDSDTGALIVEFFRMRAHEPEFANTFQVIFYDTALHPTPTGDNMFVFQYNSCNHSEGGMRYDMPYWTTGIENGAQSDGLQLAFLNILHPSVTSIGEGRAILFTAAMHTTDRNLTGTVVSLADSSPIQEALVYTNPLNVVVTDSTGYFCLPLQTSLPMHVYFEADCFNPVSRLLDPLQDEITNVTVALSRPEFILNTETLIDTLSENETASFTVSVSNPGDGILRSALTFDVHQPTMALEKQGHRWIRELDETWTRRPGFQLSTESSGYLGITHNGSNFWISGTNQDNPNNAHLLYLYTSNGELIRSCNQPVPEANRSALGMQDLAWEDGYLYGADGNVLYEMELNNGNFTVTNQLAVPVSPVTYLAVDSYRGLFWLGSTHTYITGVNLNGAVEYSIFNGSYSFAGGDLLPSAQLNENLALLSWNMATHQYRAIEVVPESGEVLPLADFTGGLLDNRPTGACITHDMQLSAWIFATIAHFEEVDSVLLWEIGPYDDWVSLPEAYIEVDPGETFDFPVSAYSSVLPPMTYTLDLVFDHNACSDNSNRVMIQMVIIDSDTPEELHDRPLEWALDAIWPNPFNPTTQIRYGLKETTTVDVQIFDILGRQVAILAHETQQAGWYTIPFTASNLSSGLYFVQINAGPLHETRKLVLLK